MVIGIKLFWGHTVPKKLRSFYALSQDVSTLNGMPVACLRLMSSAVASDLYFQCGHCGSSLVVHRRAAGMTLACQSCGADVTVPQPKEVLPTASAASSSFSEKKSELQRHLKENESQRTEITGYINQLTIQLHRWQLRLQTLTERRTELSAELASLNAKG